MKQRIDTWRTPKTLFWLVITWIAVKTKRTRLVDKIRRHATELV